ncbi:MAG: AAA family ATPase [Thiobacillus sp.]
MSQFSRLTLNNWRQFESADIDLTSQTTILTGANGCGKTSILTVLSQHFGWNLHFVATPYLSKRTKRRLFREFSKHGSSPPPILIDDVPEDLDEDIPQDQGTHEVGTVTYSDGGECKLVSPPPTSIGSQYQLQYSGMRSMVGLYIPSHRPAAIYSQVSQIPTDPKNNQQQYQEYQQLLVQMFGGGNSRNPGGLMKQSLISLALFGYGNNAVMPNLEFKDLFEEFQTILQVILPPSIGFRRLEIRMPDVVLITDSGQFALDAMSGGINALFTIAWQIHMYGAGKSSCTVLIDEPENHLHPSMQRSLLPSLALAFPRYDFVIATHSPFIVTSDPDANVFSLTHDEHRRIVSNHLSSADLAASPEKVLRDILEVPSTMPIWVENRLKTILANYQDKAGDPDAIEDLFMQLKGLGLNEALADLQPMKDAE